MDLIRNILSHFQKNKANKKAITINGVTIQQINTPEQQNNDTAEPNKEEYIKVEVPPLKKLKKDVIEVKSDDITEDNISEARKSFNEEQISVSVNNNNLFTVIDLTDNLEVHNALEVCDTAENNNISEARVSKNNQTAVSVMNDDNNMIIDLTENCNSFEVQNISEIGQTAETSKIIKAEVTSDKEIEISVNNEKNTLKNDTVEDPTSKDTISFDSKQTAVSLNNNTNEARIIDGACNPSSNNLQVSQNIQKIGETTENSNIPEDNYTMSINKNSSIATIDNTDNLNCNKLHTSKNEPKLVTDTLKENAELALINDNTEETTTECIREFEDILANVKNELTLDSEVNLDEVNDLINDFTFDSDDEFQILDTESQIPQHIIRKDVEKQIPADIIDFSYDNNITVESVDPNKPIEFTVEINNSNTERDTNIKTNANTSNTVKNSKINTIANNDDNKSDIINTNNSNTNTNTDKTEDFDTISLSSDDNTNIKDSIYISDSSDSDCGYHSSDFEFITEDEAKLEGLIINSPAYLKRKEFNAKPNCRQSKIRKITSKGKPIQAGPPRSLKVPLSGKNGQAGPIKNLGNTLTVQSGYPRTASKVQTGQSNPVQMPLNINLRPINTVQGPSYYVPPGPSNFFKRPSNIQAGPSNPVQRPSNVQAEQRNPVQNPSSIQAGPSNLIHRPLNIQTGVINPIQRPFNIQAGPSNAVQNPSNIHAGPSNPVQNPSYMQAAPSNPVQMFSNIQAGPSNNPIQRPLNMQAGPRNPVQMSSHMQAGPSNAVQVPLNIQIEPSNLVQRPLNMQVGPSSAVQNPSNIQAGPSNPVQNPSNVQPIPNYEMYRNKYKKPFQYDTAYKNNHIEPQEDGYLDLFRGFHAGVYPMYTRENKSVNPHFSNPTRMWYQGVGFDMQMLGNSSDEEDNEFKDEANETLQKIRTEYSVENRKRRFREK